MSQLIDFRAAVQDCGLLSLQFKGFKFTWNNRRHGDGNVQLYLDRLKGIFNEQGQSCTSREDVGCVFCKYFQTLFTSNGSNSYGEILEGIRNVVS